MYWFSSRFVLSVPNMCCRQIVPSPRWELSWVWRLSLQLVFAIRSTRVVSRLIQVLKSNFTIDCSNRSLSDQSYRLRDVLGQKLSGLSGIPLLFL